MTLTLLFVCVISIGYAIELVRPLRKLPIENRQLAYCGQIDGFDKDFTEMTNELKIEDMPVTTAIPDDSYEDNDSEP